MVPRNSTHGGPHGSTCIRPCHHHRLRRCRRPILSVLRLARALLSRERPPAGFVRYCSQAARFQRFLNPNPLRRNASGSPIHIRRLIVRIQHGLNGPSRRDANALNAKPSRSNEADPSEIIAYGPFSSGYTLDGALLGAPIPGPSLGQARRGPLPPRIHGMLAKHCAKLPRQFRHAEIPFSDLF